MAKKKHSRKGREPAGLKRYRLAQKRAKSGGRKKYRRKAKAAKRRRSGKRRPMMGYVQGPKKIRRRKLNPHSRRRRHRRHRNPSLRGIVGQIMPTIKAGAWGASGAIGLDVLWGLVVGRLPTVAQYLTNPYVGFVAKAAGAVAVGALGGKVARGKGKVLAEGAMTVVAHDFLKSLLQQMAPGMFGAGGSLPLGAYLSGGYGPAGDGLGAYLSGAAPIVGTATIPQAYLPFAGSSGMNDTGDFVNDRMGMDPWGA